MLRFRGIWGEIGPKKSDIAAHRRKRDAVWRESTGARCGGGRRGPGRAEASGVQGLGEWKRRGGDMWGRGRGLRKCCVGRGLGGEKRPHQGKWVAYLLLMAKIITVWEQSVEIVAK